MYKPHYIFRGVGGVQQKRYFSSIMCVACLKLGNISFQENNVRKTGPFKFSMKRWEDPNKECRFLWCRMSFDIYIYMEYINILSRLCRRGKYRLLYSIHSTTQAIRFYWHHNKIPIILMNYFIGTLLVWNRVSKTKITPCLLFIRTSNGDPKKGFLSLSCRIWLRPLQLGRLVQINFYPSPLVGIDTRNFLVRKASVRDLPIT